MGAVKTSNFGASNIPAWRGQLISTSKDRDAIGLAYLQTGRHGQFTVGKQFTGNNHAIIYARASELALREAMEDAINTYGGGITPIDDGWNGQSDHAPFDAAGYPACLLIEGDVWDNPFYHTAQDHVGTPGNINYPFATNMTRSLVGYLVDNARVKVPLPSPQ